MLCVILRVVKEKNAQKASAWLTVTQRVATVRSAQMVFVNAQRKMKYSVIRNA